MHCNVCWGFKQAMEKNKFLEILKTEVYYEKCITIWIQYLHRSFQSSFFFDNVTGIRSCITEENVEKTN